LVHARSASKPCASAETSIAVGKDLIHDGVVQSGVLEAFGAVACLNYFLNSDLLPAAKIVGCQKREQKSFTV